MKRPHSQNQKNAVYKLMNKIKYYIGAAITTLAVVCGCATEPWTRQEKAWYAASTTFMVMDWRQTHNISDRQGR